MTRFDAMEQEMDCLESVYSPDVPSPEGLPGRAADNVVATFHITGAVQPALLCRALERMQMRHETLRRARSGEGSGAPDVRLSTTLPWRFVDARRQVKQQGVHEFIERVLTELEERFDLRCDSLIRGVLLHIEETEYLLIVAAPRSASDEYLGRVLIKEVSEIYPAVATARRDFPAPLALQFPDYVEMQRRELKMPQVQAQFEYWKQQLREAPELLQLPADRSRPTIRSYATQNIKVPLGATLTTVLRALAKLSNLTLDVVIYAGWCALLSRLSGQDDLIVGLATEGRHSPELAAMIAPLSAMLPVRVKLDDDPTVTDFLLRAERLRAAAAANRDVWLEWLPASQRIGHQLGFSPIVRAAFVSKRPATSTAEFSGIKITEEDILPSASQFDITLTLHESEYEVSGTITYSSELFEDQTVRKWSACLPVVLYGLTRLPQERISSLSLLGDADHHQLIEVFNDTSCPYPQDALVHQLFEWQVNRTPDATAVEFENQSLTYSQLDDRANQLARYLRERGVGPEELVCVCMERSVEMIVALLGILKAGGAYVPIDPSHPPARQAYVLKDAGPRLLLTQQRWLNSLEFPQERTLSLDGSWCDIARDNPNRHDAMGLSFQSRQLAYVIYTSGSTGKPKGAMNEHRAVVNRLHWMQSQYQLTAADRVLQKTPYSFDVSVWEFFWPLMAGARLIVAKPNGHRDPDYLRNLIEQTQVTITHFVPSLLEVFLERIQTGEGRSLRCVICSGEELSARLQHAFFARLPSTRLVNLYGPTETAIDVTFWECQRGDTSHRVPIGRPIANTRVYILDSQGQVAPVGVIGEIHIAGDCVGRGYLKRAALTAERFSPDPFSNPANLMYKTGDLGRWRPDGAVEYIGRNDNQVKIRGHRIELGEIEAQLLREPQIKDVAVVVREDRWRGRILVAYLVRQKAGCSQEFNIDALRRTLAAVLPQYMVPSAFVMVPQLPLSSNGKLDRLALPEPPPHSYICPTYEAPCGVIESMLAHIWQVLLGVDQVGRHDRFFYLGGTSLLAVQMLAEFERVSIFVDFNEVLDNPSLSDLAAVARILPAGKEPLREGMPFS